MMVLFNKEGKVYTMSCDKDKEIDGTLKEVFVLAKKGIKIIEGMDKSSIEDVKKSDEEVLKILKEINSKLDTIK